MHWLCKLGIHPDKEKITQIVQGKNSGSFYICKQCKQKISDKKVQEYQPENKKEVEE